MSASRGIVFSTEAVMASVVFLALLVPLLYSLENLEQPDFTIMQSMAVAHDVIVERYANLNINKSISVPDGYFENGTDWNSDGTVDSCLKNFSYVVRISVDGTSSSPGGIGVCMK